MDELAEELKQAMGKSEEEEAEDFLLRNIDAIMELDIDDDEKSFLLDLVKEKGGDLEDEIREYGDSLNGRDDDIESLLSEIDGSEDLEEDEDLSGIMQMYGGIDEEF